MSFSALDADSMGRALQLARRGEGHVEPNPMVGCVIVRDGSVVGQGWHQRWGGPHAEIEALDVAAEAARGATMYVTLEPCCHHGKTPPCVEAILEAGVTRVVVAQRDPFPEVSGQGLERLRSAGVQVEVGLMEKEAQRLNAPYLKLLRNQRPWVIAKWAMSLDGKIATSTGDSKWISGEKSREVVHRLRGRVDAILVGRGTVEHDDPLLTARPPGARIATRIVLDSAARLSPSSRLVQTAAEFPVLVAAGPEAPDENRQRLIDSGCEVFIARAASRRERLDELLAELARRRMTNVLVEGGGQLLGTAFDLGAVDEVHVFIAPRIIGGCEARTPVAGEGTARLEQALTLASRVVEVLGKDLYLSARIRSD